MAEFSQPSAGPRIYNLFPLLAGRVRDWHDHLERIAAMGFSWIYVNAFHYPGFSGSLYATKDPYRLNDLFADGRDSDEALADFVGAAGRRGLKVMMDLVVNHVSKDALLVSEHPAWCRRDFDGALYSPRVPDPASPTGVTIWADLCELDFDRSDARAGLIAYWTDYLRHYARLGFAGFRGDAAYKVPADVWRVLIGSVRRETPDLVFLAETLGCTPQQVQELADVGFDYVFNSSKWWDFRSDWLLDQYELGRRIAPSVSFPESHDTSRLAAEIGSYDPEHLAEHLRFRYAFAACFSAGVMMPMGYEFGLSDPLDVVRTRPEDWRRGSLDISPFVAAVNDMKAELPALNQEGAQRRVTAPGSIPMGLLRESMGRADGCALVVLNPDRARSRTVDASLLLAETGGSYRNFRDVTPLKGSDNLVPGSRLSLEPLDFRVFVGERAVGSIAPGRGDARPTLGRLRDLATERITIEAVWPEIDGGRHPVKRVVGDVLDVWADIFCDGHDELCARIAYRATDESDWSTAPMRLYDNDRWVGPVPLARNVRYLYTIEAWRDLFASWRKDFVKKREARQDISLELVEGLALVETALNTASDADKRRVGHGIAAPDAKAHPERLAEALLSAELAEVMARIGPRANSRRYSRELEVVVDRTAARFGAWYELFPRSMSDDPRRHGTFDDVIRHLPRIRAMGFDVLYMPPIHPIGRTFRKGRNNALVATPDDPGSPYAIGSEEGGHTAIHRELGDFEAFERLVTAARREGLEIALDFAIQCSQDHPWIKSHPEWFDWRPDGSIKYAENPPKKYQDIVNVHFYREALPAIWYELRDVVLFWAARGVKIFRVDNPHTKPIPFWEWLIREVRDRDPEVIFLAEAFTRPKMMRKLAKVGFTQSYTYFTWRHTKPELTEYLTELTRDVPSEYMRANFFVNTPDINPPYLQTGGRAAFQIRAVLAATLSGVWGMYSGFELCEATPIPGREEYLDSEKYEIKAWDWDRPGNIRDFIARLNKIRRDNPALHYSTNLRFYASDDDNVLFYGKATAAGDNVIWIAVNLDPRNVHEATLELPLREVHGAGGLEAIEVEDLVHGERFTWSGGRQRVRLDPALDPCAIWRVSVQPS
ncbi:MAG TPA: maltotransferase domain-containing protein [Stellaceae bacterium]|nr:maltotransferase domain-containing protein [Stellaceae bacterium]